MSIFKKKEEINQINNKELKENLGNIAVKLLIDSKDIDENNLNGLKVEFAYLLKIENHGLEALYKVLYNNNIYYFAAQGNSVERIALNEGQYAMYKEITLNQWNIKE